jgi:hypothetical protein
MCANPVEAAVKISSGYLARITEFAQVAAQTY